MWQGRPTLAAFKSTTIDLMPTKSVSKVALIVIIFIVITFGMYSSSLKNSFVYLDDDQLILANPTVQEITPASISRALTTYDPELYIPLTLFSYQIDHLIGGLDPMIYHLSNLILHTMNALLVAWLLFILTKQKWVSVLCGILFAVHPLSTEAVAWASARKDVLSTFFFLLSLISYLRYRESGSGKDYATSIFLFAFALMAKVQVIILPVLLLLIDHLQKRKVDFESLKEKIPHFAVAIIFGIIAIIGKTQSFDAAPLSDRVLIAMRSTTFYLQKLLIPSNLSVFYPYTDPVRITNIDIALSLIIVIGLIMIIAYTWKKKRSIAFGLGFFLLALAPTFSNFNKGQGSTDYFYASDRYAYVAMIGILYLLAIAFKYFWDRSNNHRNGALIIVMIICIGFGLLSHKQSLVWRNSQSLFENAMAYSEDYYLPHSKLGSVYWIEGRMDEAEEMFNKSIELNPTAAAHYNLGIIHMERNDVDGAIEQLKRAIYLQPDHTAAHFNLGYLAFENQWYEEAFSSYSKVVEVDPTDVEALVSLSASAIKIAKFEDAYIALEKVFYLDPSNPEAIFLVRTLEFIRDEEKAE